ncbi:C40 family peptidase [Arthrobacter sp. I2-34]|uniref:C40 family peptidase n=1 Tax=Arthrobacter hankyongi TaxID=2904801 RepID=A0ABS9L4T1_9MICC|nr:C40 family peptidase [Arthrobacter hankyongi]MCG2621635.1 C40 family peptidase [Arthrobacter hankyongi]
MSLTEMLGRVQQIQSTLNQLEGNTLISGTAGTAGSAASSQGSTASAAAFAQALAAAGGTAGAAGSAPSSSVAAGTDAAGTGTNADALIAAAKNYIGLPYVWGGTDPAVGLDCSSFVQLAFRDIGIELPRVTWDQMKEGTQVNSLAEARPGDLIFSHDGGHVSIYLGNGKAIDAPQPGATIQIRDAWENDGNITTIRRVLPADGGNSGTAGTSGAAVALAGSQGAASGFADAGLSDLVAAAQAALVTGGAA